MLSLAVLLFSSFVSAVVPSIPGYRLTWSDDFNGAGRSLPSSQWRINLGTSAPGGPENWGTGEVTYYTNDPNNMCLSGDGFLVITPLKDSNGRWTSGRIESSRSDFMAAPGKKMRIQGRLQLPDVVGADAAGYWPAFWTLGSDIRTGSAWPAGGEFDIMENVNGLNNAWGTMHCGSAPGGPCNEYNGMGSSRPCPGSACQGNFHVYAMEINRAVNPETIKFMVDDQVTYTMNANQVGVDTWNKATHQGHFLMINVAMGGGFPNGVAGFWTPTDQTKPGRTMIVDYVAVYNT